MTHSTIINAVAWILTIAGAVAFAAATVGVLYCLVWPADTGPAVRTTLHDTYYVIRHSRFVVWPFLLCMCLAAAVTILGYMYTSLHMSRLMRSSVSSNTQI